MCYIDIVDTSTQYYSGKELFTDKGKPQVIVGRKTKGSSLYGDSQLPKNVFFFVL